MRKAIPHEDEKECDVLVKQVEKDEEITEGLNLKKK